MWRVCEHYSMVAPCATSSSPASDERGIGASLPEVYLRRAGPQHWPTSSEVTRDKLRRREPLFSYGDALRARRGGALSG